MATLNMGFFPIEVLGQIKGKEELQAEGTACAKPETLLGLKMLVS